MGKSSPLIPNHDTNSTQDSLQKSPKRPNGTFSITTHRLFYVDAQKGVSNSFAIDLGCTGLFKSSPKVTCHLTYPPQVRMNQRSGQGVENVKFAHSEIRRG